MDGGLRGRGGGTSRRDGGPRGRGREEGLREPKGRVKFQQREDGGGTTEREGPQKGNRDPLWNEGLIVGGGGRGGRDQDGTQRQGGRSGETERKGGGTT